MSLTKLRYILETGRAWKRGTFHLVLLCTLVFLSQCSLHHYPAPRKRGQEWGVAGEHDNVILLSAIGGSSEYPAWSPNATQIAFQHTDARLGPGDDLATRDIYIMNVDGTTERQLTRGAGHAVSCQHPSWAPDSRRLVCSCNADGDYDLYTIDTATGILTQLTDFPGDERHPAWSPDGKRVAFCSNMDAQTNRGGGWSLYTVSSDGAELRQLTEIHWYVTPAWSPDSQRLAFGSTNDLSGSGQLCIINANGSGLTCNSNAQCDIVMWSPVGSQIACTSGERIIAIRTGTGEVTTLLQADLYNLGGDSWSPDGTQLVFAAGRAELPLIANDLYLFEVKP